MLVFAESWSIFSSVRPERRNNLWLETGIKARTLVCNDDHDDDAEVGDTWQLERETEDPLITPGIVIREAGVVGEVIPVRKLLIIRIMMRYLSQYLGAEYEG